MEIERHEKFTITLTGTEAWNFCAEVEELKTMQDPKDGGAGLNTTTGLVTLREIAGTFARRQYLMPAEAPRFLSGRTPEPAVPLEDRPEWRGWPSCHPADEVD
jgi:hypothetical protein